MHRQSKFFTLATAASMLLSMAGMGNPTAVIAQGNGPGGQSSKSVKFEELKADVVGDEAKAEATYIVTLTDAPAALYAGGAGTYAPTAAFATGSNKFNPNTQAFAAYSKYLDGKQSEAAQSISKELGRNVKASHNYKVAANGFAMTMTGADAAKVRSLPGVLAVRKVTVYHLDTDAGPTWIGANTIWDGSSTGGLPATKGEGVIAGILDTGINLDHPSFAAVGGDGYTHTNPYGAGNYKGECKNTPSYCNSKLLGVYDELGEGVFNDEEGHGSHTSSTTAGNVLYNTVIDKPAGTFTATMISGVAPHANVIMYRVCGTSGCPSDAIIAGLEHAILDGVDVINYSIGSDSPSDPWAAGSDEQTFLAVRAAGIFVANSAGNAGNNASTVGSPTSSPWLIGVAATRHNRAYVTMVSGLMGGSTTPPGDLHGEALTGGVGSTPIVYAGAAPYNDALCASATADGTFAGKIVVCDRGTVGRVQKGINVKARGAVGMILVEVDNAPYAANIGGITSDPHVLPASHIGYSDGVALKAWLATGSGHMGSITAAAKVMDAATADIVASFSSRGPSRSVPDLIVPGIGAPGVSIWAAYADPVQFDMIQGTSMASPHLAGAAALVRAVHPEWTASQLQSALQLTAKYAGQYKEDGVTMADAFDIGNGRVDLTAAANAGFVMDETTANFTAANPTAGGDPKKLNLTELGNARCISSCTWTRVISSTRSTAVTYNVAASGGASVTLSAQPSSFTLAPYGKQTITVTMNVAGAPVSQWQFGRVTFTAASAQAVDAVPNASLVVAALPLAAAVPSLTDVTTPRNSGQTDVEITTGAVTALQTAVSGLVLGKQFTGSLSQDSSNDSPWDNLTDGVMVKPFFVPAGTVRLYGEMLSSTAPDLDLYLVRDMNGDRVPQAGEVIANSTSGSWTEKINRTNPTAGYYFWVIQDWNGGSAQPDTFKFSYGIVPSADAGNMTVSAPANISPGVPYNLTFKYNLANAKDGDVYYGLVTLGSSAATPNDLGRIPVNIRRVGNDVTKSASKSVAAVGDVVTYTLSIQNPGGAAFNFNLTDTIPAGMSYVPDSVTGAGASYDAGLNAIVVSGNAVATVKGDYAIEDNLANASMVNDSPFGGYVDLRENGFTVNPFGDDVAANFNTLGCNFDYWGATGGSATRVGFSSNGLFFPRGTQVAGGSSNSPLNMSIPSVITPNNFIAAYWDDLVISPTVQFTQSGYMAASAGSCPDRAIILQIVNASRYDEPQKALNYELQWYSAYPDEYWVLYDTVSSGLMSGTVGAEDYTGMKGVSYFDMGSPTTKTLTSGRVLRYYRPLVAAPPIVVTFAAKVEAGTNAILVNTASYTTDLPGTVAMNSGSASVRRAEVAASMMVDKLWQPIVANGYDATVVTALVKDSMNMPIYNQEVMFTTGKFMAALKGENEVPAVTTSASGMAELTMTPGADGMVNVDYWIDVTGIVSITAAHIHSGMAGANGPVSYWLYAGGTPFAPGKPLSGTLQMTKADAMAMAQHGMYVNVHTSANTAGEIRGQIVEEAMNASLASSKEVAVPATVAWGNALFTYDPETRNLTYRLDVNSDTTATAAHIHDGAEGVNGAVLYNLLPAGKELKPGTSLLGEVTLSAADEVKLLNGGLYVNVHTADAPAGAMRGQIGALVSKTDMNGIAYMPLASRMAGLKTIYAMTMPDVMGSTTIQFNEMLAGQEFYVRPMNLP